MSDHEHSESKTEEPTEKKINDALEKGKAPVSREISTVAIFLSFLICLSFVFDSVVPRLISALALMVESVGSVRLRNSAEATGYLNHAMRETGEFLAPSLALFVAIGIAASFIQASPRVLFDRLTPDFSRISIYENNKRLFGAAGLIELAKIIAKLLIIGGGLGLSLLIDQSLLTNAIRSDPTQIPQILSTLLIHLSSIVCILGGLFAAADWGLTRFRWRRDMRMSRQELKEEIRQSEGDALMKARMRSMAQSHARRRMMASVPRATLVLANPTHYAIALRYVREEGGAPLVLAKGKDLIALKIRDVAAEHGIPVFQKKELVRAMFEHVEVDQMIPPEFFRPVAELIHFLTAKRSPGMSR